MQREGCRDFSSFVSGSESDRRRSWTCTCHKTSPGSLSAHRRINSVSAVDSVWVVAAVEEGGCSGGGYPLYFACLPSRAPPCIYRRSKQRMSTDLPSHTSTSALAPIHRQWDVVLRCYHILGKEETLCVRGRVASRLVVHAAKSKRGYIGSY